MAILRAGVSWRHIGPGLLLLCGLAGVAHAGVSQDQEPDGHEARSLKVTKCPPQVQPPTPQVMAYAKRVATDHGYLWRISRDRHASYLYGTMHVGKPEWVWPGKQVMAALVASDTLALEMDDQDPEVQQQSREAFAKMKGNPIPPALAERLRKLSKSLCIPYEAISQMAPEMQMGVLTMFYSRWDELDPAYAMDTMLAELGHQQKKQVVSLETAEYQLQALLMADPADTVSSVEKDVSDMESGKARRQLQRLSQAWADSDYAVMEHYDDWCECKSDTDQKLMKRLLDDRNVRMAGIVDGLHKSGKKVFIAVGSMHMFGENSLPVLMVKRGYTVERIELNPTGKKRAGK